MMNGRNALLFLFAGCFILSIFNLLQGHRWILSKSNVSDWTLVESMRLSHSPNDISVTTDETRPTDDSPQKRQEESAIIDQEGNNGNASPPTSATIRQEMEGDSSVARMQEPARHKIAGLSCERYGGPSDDIAQEMVYWSDIPSDSRFTSPFKKTDKADQQYLTFEPDLAGFNNMRMSLETIVALAYATGRTLVLPPEKQYAMITDHQQGKQKTHFSLENFFHFSSIGAEHVGLDVITMEEFLERTALAGKLVDKATGRASFPPGNRTAWDGESPQRVDELFAWLRNVTAVSSWTPQGDKNCIAAFPQSSDPREVAALLEMKNKIMQESPVPNARIRQFLGNPVAVDAPPIDRMREILYDRKELCLYDEKMQNEPVIHFEANWQKPTRMLIHFYAFLFFQDWRQDLWTKRFVRDHLRYSDELQCAAARVVQAVRERTRQNQRNPNPEGVFDSLHVRRGDFSHFYPSVYVDGNVLYDSSKDELTEGSTIYIATDERDINYFQPLAEHYDICFFHDFKHLVEDINTNFYGMLDQLIASRGRTFFGTYLSTFTGYASRIRGYHAAKNKLEGSEKGVTQSYYFFPPNEKFSMRTYHPILQPFWAREFPVAWRDIDKGISTAA